MKFNVVNRDMIMTDAVVVDSGNCGHLGVFQRAPKYKHYTGFKHFLLHRKGGRHGWDSIPRPWDQQQSTLTTGLPRRRSSSLTNQHSSQLCHSDLFQLKRRSWHCQNHSLFHITSTPVFPALLDSVVVGCRRLRCSRERVSPRWWRPSPATPRRAPANR